VKLLGMVKDEIFCKVVSEKHVFKSCFNCLNMLNFKNNSTIKRRDVMQDYDLIIKPKQQSKDYFADILRFKDLLLLLTWRDILVRYKQTVIGVLWALIRPIITMIVFTVTFGKIANLPTEGQAPYAIMVFTALLPWQFFANGFTSCANSLVNGAGMLSKIYFPRLIMPISAILTALVDFAISFAILLVLMAYYGFMPSINILFLPLFVILTFFTVFSAGVLISALNVEYRDFKQIVPFIVQFGLFISPVGFSSSVVPEKYQLLYNLNPMVGIIDGFRWCILGTDTLNVQGLAVSATVTLVLMVVSLKIFRNLERTFADKI
jgi:lipopolysaccharide transport system permease protein